MSEWKCFLYPDAYWDAAYVDCEAARHTICCEQYIFDADGVGKRFLDLFLSKARQGVRVQLLLDAIGSYALFRSTYPDVLRRAGVDVRFFNPIRPWRVDTLVSWFLRDHRKLLIIDDAVGYTGGTAMNERWRGWRDTNMRVIGPVVGEMKEAFMRLWDKPRVGRFPFFGRAHDAHVGEFHFLTNSPRFRKRYIYHGLIRAIREAKQFVYLTTPYCVPSVHLFRTLTRAARRGVDVRLLLPAASDVRTADIASGAYFTFFLKAGVRVFLYEPTVMHAKTSVIDDARATIGSANLDTMSLLFSYEGDAVGTDPRFVAEVKGHFLADLRVANELTIDVWRRRPLGRKLLELLSWPLHDLY